MQEMRDTITDMLADYIRDATDHEFSKEQSIRMVRLVLQAHKAMTLTISEMTGQ